METNIVITISPQIPYLEKFWVLGYSPNYCQPIKLMNVIDDVSVGECYFKCDLSVDLSFDKVLLDFRVV